MFNLFFMKFDKTHCDKYIFNFKFVYFNVFMYLIQMKHLKNNNKFDDKHINK
jgi:hypothetical protein